MNGNGQKVDEKVDEKVNEKVNGNDVKVNANRHGLIEKLIEKAISNHDVGISVNSIMRNIDYMRGKYLRRVGPDKGGFWEIIE